MDRFPPSTEQTVPLVSSDTRAPHSALGMRSPADYRAAVTLSSSR